MGRFGISWGIFSPNVRKMFVNFLKAIFRLMATINFVLDTRHPKKNGLCPLTIVIIQNRKNLSLNLGIAIDPSDWDGRDVNPTCKLYVNYSALISQYKLKAMETLLELQQSGEEPSMNAKAIRAAISEKLFPNKAKPKRRKNLVVSVFEEFIATKTKPKTITIYKLTLSRLRAFCPNFDDLTFEDIDRKWLMLFDAFMSKTAPSPNSRAVHMRQLRAVYNYALDCEVTTNYPFRRFKIKTIKTAKRSLKVDTLRAFFDAPTEEHQKKYLDFFKLSFFFLSASTLLIFLR